MSRYKWVFHNGERLLSVGILQDGALYNPNDYPAELVRSAVREADARRHERRSDAGKKAAATKARRLSWRRKQIVLRCAASGEVICGPSNVCLLCDRRLSDAESIARGIGSECWGRILREIDEERNGR